MQEVPLKFHPLSFVDERDEVIVGRPDIDSFVVLERDGASALRKLVAGSTAVETAEWYEREYGQNLDIGDFVEALRELSFLRDADETGEHYRHRRSGPIRFRVLASWLFSWPMLAAYALIALVWLVMIIAYPEFAPRPHQMFFTDSIVAVELVAMFGQLPFLFGHEAFHALAGRRLGLPSRLGISTRLYFIVFETHMQGLLTVERRKRYMCYFAGMLFDVIAICLLGMLSYLLRDSDGVAGMAGLLALALAFPIVTRFFYQFVLFLRTDLYYVVASMLGCQDLDGIGRAFLKNHFWWALRRPEKIVDETQWTDRDRRAAIWYAPVLAVGVVVLLGIWILAMVPVALQMVSLVAEGLSSGANDPLFWDRVAFLALNFFQIVLSRLSEL